MKRYEPPVRRLMAGRDSDGKGSDGPSPSSGSVRYPPGAQQQQQQPQRYQDQPRTLPPALRHPTEAPPQQENHAPTTHCQGQSIIHGNKRALPPSLSSSLGLAGAQQCKRRAMRTLCFNGPIVYVSAPTQVDSFDHKDVLEALLRRADDKLAQQMNAQESPVEPPAEGAADADAAAIAAAAATSNHGDYAPKSDAAAVATHGHHQQQQQQPHHYHHHHHQQQQQQQLVEGVDATGDVKATAREQHQRQHHPHFTNHHQHKHQQQQRAQEPQQQGSVERNRRDDSDACPALGFDLEWTVRFVAGETPGKTAVLQVACLESGVCWLFHLPHLGPSLPRIVLDILAHPCLYKVGCNVMNDVYKLAGEITTVVPLPPASQRDRVHCDSQEQRLEEYGDSKLTQGGPGSGSQQQEKGEGGEEGRQCHGDDGGQQQQQLAATTVTVNGDADAAMGGGSGSSSSGGGGGDVGANDTTTTRAHTHTHTAEESSAETDGGPLVGHGARSAAGVEARNEVLAGFIELSDLATSRFSWPSNGGSKWSLSGVCERALRCVLDKPQDIRTGGNWDGRPLTHDQMSYAATDAWASIRCYQALLRMPVINTCVPSVPRPLSLRLRPTLQSSSNTDPQGATPTPTCACERTHTHQCAHVSGTDYTRTGFISGAIQTPTDAHTLPLKALPPLPPSKREAHRLFHHEGLTLAEVASARAFRVTTAASYITDAIEAGYPYHPARVEAEVGDGLAQQVRVAFNVIVARQQHQGTDDSSSDDDRTQTNCAQTLQDTHVGNDDGEGTCAHVRQGREGSGVRVCVSKAVRPGVVRNAMQASDDAPPYWKVALMVAHLNATHRSASTTITTATTTTT